MYSTSQTGARSLITLFILYTIGLVSTEPNAQMLNPARAVYDLRLNNERDSGKIYSVTGRLIVELIENCSGFIFNHGFISSISAAGSSDLVHNTEASVWESRDGQTMRFTMTQKINGTVVEQEQGQADITDKGESKAVWLLPQSRTLKLPHETLFPISYNRIVTKKALSGSRGFQISLFDGSNKSGYYHAAVFIGPRQKKIPNLEHQFDTRSWPVRIAYYNYDTLTEIPEFEIGFMLYGDGIVDDLRLDYKEFGLIGILKKLEYLDQPKCE